MAPPLLRSLPSTALGARQQSKNDPRSLTQVSKLPNPLKILVLSPHLSLQLRKNNPFLGTGISISQQQKKREVPLCAGRRTRGMSRRDGDGPSTEDPEEPVIALKGGIHATPYHPRKMQPPFIYKICMLGAQGTGKSSVAYRLVSHTFDPIHRPTRAAAQLFWRHFDESSGHDIMIEIEDTPGLDPSAGKGSDTPVEVLRNVDTLLKPLVWFEKRRKDKDTQREKTHDESDPLLPGGAPRIKSAKNNKSAGFGAAVGGAVASLTADMRNFAGDVTGTRSSNQGNPIGTERKRMGFVVVADVSSSESFEVAYMIVDRIFDRLQFGAPRALPPGRQSAPVAPPRPVCAHATAPHPRPGLEGPRAPVSQTFRTASAARSPSSSWETRATCAAASAPCRRRTRFATRSCSSTCTRRTSPSTTCSTSSALRRRETAPPPPPPHAQRLRTHRHVRGTVGADQCGPRASLSRVSQAHPPAANAQPHPHRAAASDGLARQAQAQRLQLLPLAL